MSFPRATELAHDLVRERLKPGDFVIDATVGNGHDTLFLAELVGPSGRVVGFDIQADAIETTRKRLADAGVLDRVELKQASHENNESLGGSFQVVMFNFGYLPGGDKAVVTRPETTLAAMRAALDRLAAGGLMTLVIYSGHAGGGEEAEAVLDFSEALDQKKFAVIRYGFLNQANHPPFLIAIEKRSNPVESST